MSEIQTEAASFTQETETFNPIETKINHEQNQPGGRVLPGGSEEPEDSGFCFKVS